MDEPERQAYSFLPDGDTDELRWTYAELDRQARAIGAALQASGATGGRALIFYPPGLDYIAAFFGCLYAGVVAVPTYPPRMNRSLPRTQAIVRDAQATIALTTGAVLSSLESLLSSASDLGELEWIATDQLAEGLEDDWREPRITQQTLAFLQYTSGSTGTPKGVIVSHENLLHNSTLLAEGFGYSPETRCVTWLPLYHDMGLIGGVLQPLHGGFHNTLMSPMSFLRNPLRWLEVISSRRATLSGAPNFAYELCVRRMSGGQQTNLDLSMWDVAFTGAEPIRPDTLERFNSTFAPYGFRRGAFFSCYGLAEATLIVSGGPKDAPPYVHAVDRVALAQHRIAEPTGENIRQRMVSCGRVLPGQRVVIVHPDSLTACAPAQVGEVWVAGGSVAQGYWNRLEETEQTFKAHLAGTGEGPFLRTGDLGYLLDGNLFITGRLKDIIIIRGRNHYPQDIEATVEQSDGALRPGCGAAFPVEVDNEERLVIVQEVESSGQSYADAIIEGIRRSVAVEHELQASTVVLVRPKTIPKTSSGKIQRHACRAKFLDGTLSVVKASSLGVEEEAEFEEERASKEALLTLEPEQRRTLLKDVLRTLRPEQCQTLLEAYLRKAIARALGRHTLQLDGEQPLSTLGLDSLMAVELQHGIETDLNVVLSMASFLQDTTLTQLVAQVLGRLDAPDALAIPTPAFEQSPALEQAATDYPLSPGQRGLWFLHELAPDSVAYNIARAVRLRTALDVEALRRAFQTLLNRHAALRATFVTVDGDARQRIREHVEVSFVVHNAATWSASQLHEHLTREGHRPFNLEQGPLLRINLFKRGEDDCFLLLVVHHIAVDFWSLAILMHELGELYQADTEGRTAHLSTLPLQYTDEARRQTELLHGAEGERLWSYWKKQLAGDLPVLRLPTDRPRPTVQTYRGSSQTIVLDADLARRLKSLGVERGATLYMTLLAAFQTLLQRYTGQEEIIVGSPTNGRHRADLMGLVGYFVNSVPMRADLSGDPTFGEFLERTRQVVLGALEHQHYPFAHLVERLQPVRDPAQSPIFQVMFALQKAQLPDRHELAAFALGDDGAEVNWGGLVWQAVALQQRVAQFDLTSTLR